MATQNRENFMAQVNAELLSAVRELAQREGRQMQAIVDEAFADLLEKRQRAQPRANVMAAYQASHEKFAPLYQKLAE